MIVACQYSGRAVIHQQATGKASCLLRGVVVIAAVPVFLTLSSVLSHLAGGLRRAGSDDAQGLIRIGKPVKLEGLELLGVWKD